MQSINMNVKVRVILTHTGADCYNIWHADCYNIWHNRFNYPKDCKPKRLTVGDELYIQLWELMQIFGPMMFNGMREVPFRNNEICLT